MVKDIFNSTDKNWMVFFNRVVNWGTFTANEFKKVDINNPDHTRYSEFLKVFNTIPKSRVNHNLTIV